MIPKIVHYCWFGKKPYPEKVKKCIESWEHSLSNYQFMLWNEDNFDITSVDFVNNAYSNGKFAFVSDYVRIYALQKFGGIYLDTDIEVLKSFDNIIDNNNNIILGTDEGGFLTAFMASEKNQELWEKVLFHYNNMKFSSKVSDNLMVNNKIIQKYLKQYGYKEKNEMQILTNKIIIYPDTFFHAKSLKTGKFNITNDTLCIHHHTTLWVSKKTMIVKYIRLNILIPLIGEDKYTKLVKLFKKNEK